MLGADVHFATPGFERYRETPGQVTVSALSRVAELTPIGTHRRPAFSQDKGVHITPSEPSLTFFTAPNFAQGNRFPFASPSSAWNGGLVLVQVPTSPQTPTNEGFATRVLHPKSSLLLGDGTSSEQVPLRVCPLLPMKEGFSPVQLLRQIGLRRVGVPGRPESLGPPIDKRIYYLMRWSKQG